MQAKELLDGLMEQFRKVAATETIVGAGGGGGAGPS
jgi:uncharacterized spore protein YtfJ